MPSPQPRWLDAKEGLVPPNQAVAGGIDIDGETLYVGRASHDGHLVPGKIRPSHGVCYIPYGGREVPFRSYQVLTHNGYQLEWVACKRGSLPMGVVPGGRTADGTILYIGRTRHEGSTTLGKILGNSIYIPFDGHEIRSDNYEILCLKHAFS